MKLRENIEYGAVAGLLGLCRILPESFIRGLFKTLGLLLYGLLPSRRKLALSNTEIAFPDRSLAERKRIVRKSFINLSESMAFNILIMSGRLNKERLLDMIEVEGWEKVQPLLDVPDKGVLVFSAHLGNWELMPQYAALRTGRPVNVISRKSNNALIEDRIVRPLREYFGVNIHYKKNAIMKMVKAINRGEGGGMLVDQRISLRRGVPVEFFGKVAGTIATPALLQIRFGIPTLPMFMVKQQLGQYRLIVGDPVKWEDNGKPMDEQVLELTRIHQKIIEDMIVRYPEQWFWVHDRWGLKKGKR